MQNYLKTIGALVAASALVAGNASAEVEYEIHTAYSTEYIFRGINLGDDLVEAGVDVSTEYMGLGLSAGAWYGSFSPAANVDGDELDIYGEVSKDLGFVTAAIGYISYQNLRGLGDDAQEIYFAVSKSFSGFDTSLAYFWDIETDNDGYAEANVSYDFELSQCLVLTAGGTLGYLAEQGELSHAQLKLALAYAFTETATLTPYIANSWSLSEEGLYGNSENELFAGVNLSVSF